MASTRKKVVVRHLNGDLTPGYLPAANFLRRQPSPLALDLLDLAGRTLPIDLALVKTVSFVRDFNLDDTQNPERLTRRAFLARPRNEGLWLRITFPTGDQIEGLAPLDTTLLDALLDDAGLFLTPPDDRTNTHRLYVPRSAIATLQLLAVITTPSRKPAKPSTGTQADLFPPMSS
jgi:hypothetical protein